MNDKPKLLRMREGKEGGGKGPLWSEDMSLTLTGIQDVLFQPQEDPTPPSSAESEVLTSDLSEQDGTPSPSASSPSTPPPSSPSGGQTSPTSVTSRPWVTSGEEMIDGSGYHREKVATDVTPTLNGYSTPLVGSTPLSGQEASPAKTSPSQESEKDLPVTDPALPSPSSTFWTDTEMSPTAGSFSKMYRGSSTHMPDGIWRDSSVRWGTSGLGGPTDAWTGATSTCRSVGSECSSSPTRLQDILMKRVPERFLLSARAAEGILRRAAKRGRSLPPTLEAALLGLLENTSDPEATPTTPSSAKPSAPSGQRDTADPQEMNTTTSWTVRKLTPLETELLMGWPPGHTISKNFSRKGKTDTGTKPVETE